MKKITFLLFAILITNFSYSQCTSGSETGTSPEVSNEDGELQDIAFGIEAGEFVVINGLDANDNYEFTSNRTATPNADYITITQDNDPLNTVIAHGLTPLNVNTINFTSVKMYINLDAACTTDVSFHDATIQNITEATCNKPVIKALIYRSDTRMDFSWTAPILSTPTGYDWEFVPQGNAQGDGVVASGSTVAPTTTASTGDVLTPNTTYDLRIRSNCGGSGTSDYIGPFSLTTNSNPPPVNDFCSGAIAITEETSKEDAASAIGISGSILDGAGTDVPAEVCGSDPDPGNARDDVWYSFIAQTEDVKITFEPSNFDGVVTLYSGDCNTLSDPPLACSDNNISSPSVEEISISGIDPDKLTIGSTYYVRVYYYGTKLSSSRNFDLKIWSPTVVADSDSDGFSDAVDCDDIDPAINPGAQEICDGIDNDCDGLVDDADPDITGQSVWYADTDSDGFGDDLSSVFSCSQPTDYVLDNTDCDDSESTVYPGAPEICDGIDNDCDGLVDDADPDITGQSVWYADTDSDGFGDDLSSVFSCSQPTDYVSDNTDCDDSESTVYPGAPEICDGIDNDCDGLVDDADTSIDPSSQTTYYVDGDLDGYGDNLDSGTLFCNPPAGYELDNTDCDDDDFDVNPGATEIENNGIDDDCNPATLDDPPLGTEDFNIENISVKPNPFNQRISIHLPLSFNNNSFEIKLFDLHGRTIFNYESSSINGRINIENLNNIQQGPYFIKITNKGDGKNVIRQLIKF